jgi:hypothetical protein
MKLDDANRLIDAHVFIKHGKKPGVSEREKKKMRESFSEYKRAWRNGSLWPTKL